MPKRKAPPPPAAAASSDEEERDSDASASDATSDSDSGSDFPSEEGAASDAAESEDDEDGAAFASIDVDFEFFNPGEKDFHGLRALLQNFLDGRQYGCSALVDAVVAAPVGTVIKCGEDDDPIGVATVLGLHAHRRLQPLVELKAFLLEHAPDAAAAAALEAAWGARGAALLLSERLMNCPPVLAPPLMEALFAEVAAAAAAPETRAAFAFDRYLLVSRAYVDPEAAPPPARKKNKGGGGGGGKRKGGAAPAAAGGAGAALIHATPEGEFLSKRAAWRFAFPVPGRAVGKGDLAPHREVALVEAAQVPAALRELRAVLPAP
jgi:protein BCP1